jgi:hypothetical protein
MKAEGIGPRLILFKFSVHQFVLVIMPYYRDARHCWCILAGRIL